MTKNVKKKKEISISLLFYLKFKMSANIQHGGKFHIWLFYSGFTG